MYAKNPYCPAFIEKKPALDLTLVVTIPCYNEPDIVGSLQSLYECDRIEGSVEVILLINNCEVESDEIKAHNLKSYQDALAWAESNQSDHIQFHIHYFDNLPKKHAGVGLARKIAMDEAANRLMSINNPNGIIQCYDADCRCDHNLIKAVQQHFNNSNSATVGIHYEHPIEGDEYSSEIYDAIISYELHLRYYANIQRFIELPFAFQTIGSSMAVTAKDYVLQGGMNKKKAGEDFYFLQKYIILDQHEEISNTKVIPSPRQSDRVPFGTGKAVNDIISKTDKYLSYNPKAFLNLRIMLDDLPYIYQLSDIKDLSKNWPQSITSYFVEEEDMQTRMNEIKSNTKDYETFKKRFFKWLTAFRLMKYLHFCRDNNIISDIPVLEAAYLFITNFLGINISKTEKDMLLYLRKRDIEYVKKR